MISYLLIYYTNNIKAGKVGDTSGLGRLFHVYPVHLDLL